MNSAQASPALAGSERDNDGRLVKLIFESTPPLQAPDANPWLVAVDGSDNALRAVEHAMHQADEMNACALHLVQVQPWLSKEAAEAELAHRAWLATARARALLD
ncbi:MAG: universal stress protein, partial [Sulfuritalea sp.]|nr:universal stress protein [Sulfuritalea sp.]